MVHSEKLGETVLWRGYQGKISPNEKRSSWVKEVYEAAATYMMDVRQRNGQRISKGGIEEMVRELQRIYGENIQQIILFGSTARMDAAPDSDIDIAVILRQELSHDKRVEFLEWSAEFDMKYEKVFSFIDIEKEKMEQWGDILPFYKNIQKEGIVLWKTA